MLLNNEREREREKEDFFITVYFQGRFKTYGLWKYRHTIAQPPLEKTSVEYIKKARKCGLIYV